MAERLYVIRRDGFWWDGMKSVDDQPWEDVWQPSIDAACIFTNPANGLKTASRTGGELCELVVTPVKP